MTYAGPTEFVVDRVEDVHDGDTFHLTVHLGFRARLTIDCRLDGWDCPELSSSSRKLSEFEKAEAARARSWTSFWFLSAMRDLDGVHIRSTPDPETWNRWLVTPWSVRDHQPLGGSLQRQALAVPWHKAGDPKWWQVYDRGATTSPPTGGGGS